MHRPVDLQHRPLDSEDRRPGHAGDRHLVGDDELHAAGALDPQPFGEVEEVRTVLHERAEQALSDWQSQWDDYALSFSEAEQIRNVEKTRFEQLESRISSLVQRRKKLNEEENGGNSDELRLKHEKLVGNEQRKRQARDEFERALSDIAEKIRKLREQDAKLTRLVDERMATLSTAESKHASIEAIQKAALGQSDEIIQSWLESAGLGDNDRVAQCLDVEDGWERAVETVLGDYLQAVCVSDVVSAVDSLGQLQSGNLTLLDSGNDASEAPNDSTLAAKVNQAPAAIMDILQSVRIAPSLESALEIRDQIGSAGSVVTADGIWISEGWLRVRRDKDPQAGVLGRGHDMRPHRRRHRPGLARSPGTHRS